MKNINLLLILGISTLFGCSININQVSNINQSSNMPVFHNMSNNSIDDKDYSVEELLGAFFNNREVSITKKSEAEFYISDSNYYLSYVNGDISYTHRQVSDNYQGYQEVFKNILLQNSLETMKVEYDTKEIEGITRVQALEKVIEVSNKLGLELEEEPYVFLGFESELEVDCYYILWNYRLSATAYKTMNYNSSWYRNHSGTNIGNTILAVVTKDGVVELEVSKVCGSLQGTE